MVIIGNTKNPISALMLVHGRGTSAESIISLTKKLTLPGGYIVVAPQANENIWYPERFIVPITQNQPHLDSALNQLSVVLKYLKETHGIRIGQVILAGFSQGACVVAEFIKRNPGHYKGVAIFSGGLIGDDGEVLQKIDGDLMQTSIYLGCDLEDFHIPKNRFEQSAEIFTKMNAQVELKLYSDLGHTIHKEGIMALQKFISN